MSNLRQTLLLSIVTLLLSASNGFPNKMNYQTTQKSSESQASQLSLGFVPITSTHVHSTELLQDESLLNPIPAEQNFFPLFYGNGPFLNRHAVNPSSSERFLSSFKAPVDKSILGSGDFTVLGGGTFFSDNEDISNRPPVDIKGSRFYDSIQNGRPFALPLKSSNDPFANFKDFAELTAGVDTDFSHLIAVYTKPNSSKAKYEPKNILEQLQLIDEEQRKEQRNEKISNQDTKASKSKSLNRYKAKLMSTVLSKELRKKEMPRKKSNPLMDYIDPLEAAS